MRHPFSIMAVAGIALLGLGAAIPRADAAALAAGASAANGLRVAVQADSSEAVEVHYDRRRHKHRRNRRPHTGFYFEFGTGGHRLGPAFPYYVPRYVVPRHVVPRRTHRLPAVHIRWCYNRYRSYRDWDNSFQPYHGPRKPCRSPYLR